MFKYHKCLHYAWYATRNANICIFLFHPSNAIPSCQKNYTNDRKIIRFLTRPSFAQKENGFLKKIATSKCTKEKFWWEYVWSLSLRGFDVAGEITSCFFWLANVTASARCNYHSIAWELAMLGNSQRCLRMQAANAFLQNLFW